MIGPMHGALRALPEPTGVMRRTVWPHVRPRLAFAALLLVVVWAYLPSLNRFFAGDQLLYLAELDGDRSWSTGLGLLDYSGARQFNKGDELLYRPVLMFWLAAQNVAFGVDFRAWNLVNLAAHLAVVWLLFEVLWRMHPCGLAHAFAGWFALLAANFELVTWSHLGGYMLGYGLLLAALLAAGTAWRSGRPRAWLAYALAVFPAMLVHEIAVVAAVLVPLMALPRLIRAQSRPHPRIAWVALLAPLAVFAGLYAIHAARCARLFWVDPGDGRVTPWTLPLQMLAAWKIWIVRILFPARVDYWTAPFKRTLWALPLDAAARAALLVQIGAWIGIAASLRKAVRRERWKQAAPFAGLVALLLAAYTAMNCLGRTSFVAHATYYPYFCALFGAVGICSLLDFSGVRRRDRWIAAVLIAGLGLGNGLAVRRASERMNQANRPVARYHELVARAVRPRLADPNFTFAVANPDREVDPFVTFSVGYYDQNIQRRLSVTEILYGPRHSHFLPTIRLTVE